MTDDTLSRRQVLRASIATGLAAGVAGCTFSLEGAPGPLGGSTSTEESGITGDGSTSGGADSAGGGSDGTGGGAGETNSGGGAGDDGGPTDVDATAAGSQSSASVGYGETITGSIQADGPTAPEYGGLADPVTFEGESGDVVSVTMVSEAFDTYLVLQAPDGSVVAQNDDRPSDFNSAITQVLSQSGTYTVWCTSWNEGATGDYELTVEKTGEGGTSSGGDGPSISYGETITGSIEQDDPTAPEYGGLAEPVTFEGESGDGVRITMVSEAFDTYLVLQAPDGSVVAQNDDRASDFNSEISTTLSQSGTYTVWCSSWNESATGVYELTLERTD